MRKYRENDSFKVDGYHKRLIESDEIKYIADENA